MVVFFFILLKTQNGNVCCHIASASKKKNYYRSKETINFSEMTERFGISLKKNCRLLLQIYDRATMKKCYIFQPHTFSLPR